MLGINNIPQNLLINVQLITYLQLALSVFFLVDTHGAGPHSSHKKFLLTDFKKSF